MLPYGRIRVKYAQHEHGLRVEYKERDVGMDNDILHLWGQAEERATKHFLDYRSRSADHEPG